MSERMGGKIEEISNDELQPKRIIKARLQQLSTKIPSRCARRPVHGWQRRWGRLSVRLVNNFLRLNASEAINSRFVLSSLYQLSECLQKKQEKQVALLARKTFRWGGRFFPRQSDLSSRHARRDGSCLIPRGQRKPRFRLADRHDKKKKRE